LQLLTISLAKPFLSNTTWQARHGQLAEQFYLFIQTPLDSHLTGEAWPACRANLPFHSNTTWQARHGQLAEQFYLFQTPLDRRGMTSLQGNCTSSNTTRQARHASLAWSLYIVRTSNIAKNRHKHRFASGTVSKNRHLYRIRCDTFGPALARKNTKPWRSTPIHV